MNSHVVINLETINDPDEDLVTETNPDVLFVLFIHYLTPQRLHNAFLINNKPRTSAFGRYNKQLSVSYLTVRARLP